MIETTDDRNVLGELKPQAPLVTFSLDRLYTASASMLCAPVHELLGAFAEVAVLDASEGVQSKWIAFERIKLPRRHICTGPSDCIVYGVHYRIVHENCFGEYCRRLIAWSPTKQRAYGVGRSVREIEPALVREMDAQFAIVASFVEDASLFWHAKVTNGKSVTLYTDEPALKELADLRDSPTTATNRRKPVLHWVRSHKRVLQEGRTAEIERHLRGISQFDIDGFQFSISKPQKP